MKGPVIYVEGGGDRGSDLAKECKQAFARLFREATQGKNLEVRPCGSRNAAYEAFELALNDGRDAVLLVDAEDLVAKGHDAWKHLSKRDKWKPLPGDAFLMAVCMETWIVADLDALRTHFQQDFNADKVKKWPSLEAVRKETIFSTLESATKSRKGGPYHKGRDSFKLLALVDPKKLAACPNAAKLFKRLKQA